MARKGKQLGLFKQDLASTVREDGVPVYRVCLVREGRMPCYNQQIRSAVDASTLLHTYLADVDREHFVIILLNLPIRRTKSPKAEFLGGVSFGAPSL
jgi:hypothetical protein